MLSTTYAVGELSALNGVMGAKPSAHSSSMSVGMPSYQNQRLRKCMHHTLETVNLETSSAFQLRPPAATP